MFSPVRNTRNRFEWFSHRHLACRGRQLCSAGWMQLINMVRSRLWSRILLFVLIYSKGSFRGHLSSSPQRPHHSSTRRRGDVNPVVHFFRSFVSIRVCWHGFLQAEYVKGDVKPTKEKINPLQDTWMMFHTRVFVLTVRLLFHFWSVCLLLRKN